MVSRSRHNGATNFFYEMFHHDNDYADMADGYWRSQGMFEPATPEHAFNIARHMVHSGDGHNAWKIHKKVPHAQQDRAIEHLTLPHAPRRDLQFIPAHLMQTPPNLEPQTLDDLADLANHMSRMHYTQDEIGFRLEQERQILEHQRGRAARHGVLL